MSADVARLDRIARQVARRLTSAAPQSFEDAVNDAWLGMLARLADNPDAHDGELRVAAIHQVTEGLRGVGYAVSVPRDAERAFRRTRAALDNGAAWVEVGSNIGVKTGYLRAHDYAVLSGRADLESTTETNRAVDHQDELDREALAAVADLSPEDLRLVALHHGLDGGPRMTTREIAVLLGNTSHMSVARRLRQIHGQLREAATAA